MPQILFIGDAPLLLALMENLQPRFEGEIRLESEYGTGIRAIFDDHPAVVFLQSRIAEVSSHKVASQVKMLLHGEEVPLVLLSDEAVLSSAASSPYEECLDLCLPLEELSRQVLQLLHKLAEPTELQAPRPTEDFHSFEMGLPASLAELTMPFEPEASRPWSTEAITPSAEATGVIAALEGNSVDFPPLASLSELPQTLDRIDFLDDPFAIEPIPALFQEAARIEPNLPEPSNLPQTPAQPAAAARQKPFIDLRSIEKAAPSQLFGSISESPAPPPVAPLRPRGPKPSARAASSAAPRNGAPSAPKGQRPAPPVNSPRPPPPSAMHTDSAPDDDAGSVPLWLGISETRSYRGVAIVSLLFLAVVGLVFIFTWQHYSKPHVVSYNIHDAATKQSSAVSASSPSVPRHLPLFIPPVSPDPGYGASHPGWERYLADGVEYLVYREAGRIRAVQVVSQQRGAVSVPFFKTCVRIGCGQDTFDARKVEIRNGIEISSGTMPNGAEVVLYRDARKGDIRGFVISFPDSGPAPTVTAS